MKEVSLSPRAIFLVVFWLGLLSWPLTGWINAVKLSACLAAIMLAWRYFAFLFKESRWVRFLLEKKRVGADSLQHIDKKPFVTALALLLLILPVLLNDYHIDILSLAWLYALLAVGLNITVGYTGLLDLGYAGFYGIGAYAYALFSPLIGFWIGLLFGGGVAALFGMILGLITLRLRGDYLAIVTLGFVQIVYLILNNWDSVTNGPNGILNVRQPEVAGFVLHRPIHFYYLVLILLGVVAMAVHRLVGSQIGRAWIAIREDPIAAEAIGIPTTRIKVLAFTLGAGVAGMAGVFFAARYAFVSPESFNFLESVRILSMVVLGGMGSLHGAILGAILLTLLPEMFRGLASYRMLIFGAALVVMMLFRPQGLLGKRT